MKNIQEVVTLLSISWSVILVGDKGMSFLTSRMVSVVISLILTVVFTTTDSVCSDLSSKRFPCALTRALKITMAALFYLFQTPTMWLAFRELLIHVIQYVPYICKYSFIVLYTSSTIFCSPSFPLTFIPQLVRNTQ